LDGANSPLLGLASSALVGVRKAKSDAKVSMKAAVESAVLEAPAAVLTSLRLLETDLKAVGRIETLGYGEGEEVAMVEVILKAIEEA
jgi:valyl-tRNA synthetase